MNSGKICVRNIHANTVENASQRRQADSSKSPFNFLQMQMQKWNKREPMRTQNECLQESPVQEWWQVHSKQTTNRVDLGIPFVHS